MSYDREQVRLAADISKIIGNYVELKVRGKERVGLCPFHQEKTPSFTVSNNLFKCFGCGAGGDIFEFIKRVENLNTFPEQLARVAEIAGVPPVANGARNGHHYPEPRVVAIYRYTDEQGELLYQVRRFEPGYEGKLKSFKQRRPDGRGGWIENMDGVRRVLFNLPAVVSSEVVGYTEGEKDALTLGKYGWTATTISGGVSGTIPPDLTLVLGGKKVYLFGDNDVTGQKFIEKIGRQLMPVAEVFRVEVPTEFKDITEYCEAGYSDLAALKSVPFQPAASAPNRILEREPDPQIHGINPEENWPSPLGEGAFHGVAGEVVRALLPHTEADEAGLLVQLLTAFGSVAGRNSFYRAGADQHFGNLFSIMVGRSSKGRKGSSWSLILWVLKLVYATRSWASDRVKSGLSSGEGLIWSVRDPIETQEPIRDKKSREVSGYQTVVTDPGVADKRLLVLEPEFASVLKIAERDGSTLSPVIRLAWDTGNLSTMTKNAPGKATGAHISMIGHITKDELLRYLTTSESANGFANRFLWVCVKRSKLLPDGGDVREADVAFAVQRLSAALDFASVPREMKRDSEAAELWHEVYPTLSGERSGMFGSVTSRAEAQTLRLSSIYALLDCSPVIRLSHLAAALEVWRYCDDSARCIFGESLGDKVADAIMQALRAEPQGLTREQMSVELFGRNKRADEIVRALTLLKQLGVANCETEQSGGRPRERWFATAGVSEFTSKASAKRRPQ